MVSPRDLVVLVNYQLMLGWGLNRQVSWHFTLKDKIDKASRAAHQIDRREFRSPTSGSHWRRRLGFTNRRGRLLSSGAQFVPTSLRRYGASNYTEDSGMEIL
jgi:hypothetical protein